METEQKKKKKNEQIKDIKSKILKFKNQPEEFKHLKYQYFLFI